MKSLGVTFEESLGWIVTERPAGPAGTVSISLDSGRITLDALETGVLVEMVLVADDPRDQLDPVLLGLVERLFDAGAAARMRAAVNGSLTVETTEVWDQLALAAQAEVGQSRSGTRLSGLDTVAVADLALLPELASLVLDRAWAALPAVAALGRAATVRPAIVDALSPAQRRDLNRRVDTLRAVLGDDDWDGSGAGDLSNLSLLLGIVPDWPPDHLMDRPDAENLPSFMAGVFEGTDVPGSPTRVQLRLTAADIAPRLGAFGFLAYAGLSAQGEIPGQVEVRVPLRPEALDDAQPNVTVRVLAWDGRVLAEGSLVLRTPRRAGLPVGTCRLNVAVALAVSDTIARGVFIDVAVDGAAPLDQGTMERLTRGQGVRSGVAAVLAHRRGDVAAEADAWRRCAALLRSAGDEAGSRQAAVRALRVGSASSTDWCSAVTGSWAAVVRDTLSSAPGEAHERVELLKGLVGDLGRAFTATPELALAHGDLGWALLEAAHEEEQTAGWEHLHEALRLHLDLGDEPAANSLTRRMSEAAASD